MGWLLRHNWLWALLAFALGALITWFLVRRAPGEDRETAQEARPATKQASQPVRRREPVLVGAGGGAGGDATETAEADRDTANTPGEPVNGEHEPMGNDQESISANRQPVVDDHETAFTRHEAVPGNHEGVRGTNERVHGTNEPVQSTNKPVHGDNEAVQGTNEVVHGDNEPAHGNHESVRGEEEATVGREPAPTSQAMRPAPPVDADDQSGAEQWREPMHEGWELTHPDDDHSGPREAVPQQPEPVSPIPSIDPASEFSERMESEPAPDPAKDGPAAQAGPPNGVRRNGVPAADVLADAVLTNGVLMDGEMAQPEGAGEVPPGRYGEGSADALPHQSAPDGYTIKGNEQSMLFHTPDSPSYGRTRPQVWFRTEADAERAGFTKYVREPHPLGN